MNFIEMMGLDKSYLNKDKFELSTVLVQNRKSSNTPITGTPGIYVKPVNEKSPFDVCDYNTNFFDEQVDDMMAVPGEAMPVDAIPVPVAVGLTKKIKLPSKSNNSSQFVVFPFCNEFNKETTLRKKIPIKKFNRHELLFINTEFELHKTAKIIVVDTIPTVDFDLLLHDIYDHGAVVLQTGVYNKLVPITIDIFREASKFFKYNCLFKKYIDTGYMNASKFGSATYTLSCVKPSSYMPIFGKEDGCIIHLTIANNKNICFEFVALATNNAESLLEIDGQCMYNQNFKNRFYETVVPKLKKYGTNIRNSFVNNEKKKTVAS